MTPYTNFPLRARLCSALLGPWLRVSACKVQEKKWGPGQARADTDMSVKGPARQRVSHSPQCPQEGLSWVLGASSEQLWLVPALVFRHLWELLYCPGQLPPSTTPCQQLVQRVPRETGPLLRLGAAGHVLYPSVFRARHVVVAVALPVTQ